MLIDYPQDLEREKAQAALKKAKKKDKDNKLIAVRIDSKTIKMMSVKRAKKLGYISDDD